VDRLPGDVAADRQAELADHGRDLLGRALSTDQRSGAACHRRQFARGPASLAADLARHHAVRGDAVLANSTAIASVRPTSAAFAVITCARLWAPTYALTPPMLTTVPPPHAIIGGRQARAQKPAVDNDAHDVPPPVQADLGKLRLLPVGGVVGQDVDAAQARERRLDHGLHRGLVGHVRQMDQSPPAARFDLRSQRVGLITRAAGVDHDGRAVPSQRQRDRPADPAHGTRHQCDTTVQLSSSHVTSPLRTLPGAPGQPYGSAVR
jgi:hypothetical protein